MSRPLREAKSKALLALHQDDSDDDIPLCPPPLSQRIRTGSGILPQPIPHNNGRGLLTQIHRTGSGILPQPIPHNSGRGLLSQIHRTGGGMLSQSVSLPQNGGRGLQLLRQNQTLSMQPPLPGGDHSHSHLAVIEKDRSASVSSDECHAHSTNDFGTDSDSSPSSECSDDDESENDVILSDISDEDYDIPPADIPAQQSKNFVSKNGRVWSRERPNHIGRRDASNVVTKRMGVPKHVNVHTLMDAFQRYVTPKMVALILRETNREAKRAIAAGEISQSLVRKWHDISEPELYGYFGILYLTGSLKLGFVHTNDIWKYGPAPVKAAMSEEYFRLITKFLRFDNKDTRSVRRKNDKLAPLREIWDMFITQCRSSYTPSEEIVVDEQIVPTRGRCSFKVYMPQKPDKYGIKIWALVCAKTKYFFNAEVYLGKVGNLPEKGQASRVVLQLTEPISNSGRNVTTDQFFTSVTLAQELKKRRLSLVGTLNKRKPDIPSEFVSTAAKIPLSSMFGFSEGMMLISYISKKGKVVTLLSTMHNAPDISDEDHKKPVAILNYNMCKGGVDSVDQLAHRFTARRKSRRWPLTLFGNLLDLAAINAMIIFKMRNISWSTMLSNGHRRTTFLRELAMELIKICIDHRVSEHPSGALQPGPRQAIESTLGHLILATDFEAPDESQVARRACHMCTDKSRRIKQKCVKCHHNVCNEHCKLLCAACFQIV
jgi:hypothetical protein